MPQNFFYPISVPWDPKKVEKPCSKHWLLMFDIFSHNRIPIEFETADCWEKKMQIDFPVGLLTINFVAVKSLNQTNFVVLKLFSKYFMLKSRNWKLSWTVLQSKAYRRFGAEEQITKYWTPLLSNKTAVWFWFEKVYSFEEFQSLWNI